MAVQGGKTRWYGAWVLAWLGVLSMASAEVATGEESRVSSGLSAWVHPPAVRHARLEHRRYASQVLGTEVGYQVWLPPGYGEGAGRGVRHPVVYWLHDRDGDEGRPALGPETLEAGVRGGILPPFVVVYVCGGARTWFRNTADGLQPAELTLMEELIPHIDRTYRTVGGRDGRVLLGVGMGGFGAIRLAAAHPERFCAGGAVAGDFREVTEFTRDRAMAEEYLRVFGGDAGRFVREGPLGWARTNAMVLRERTGFWFFSETGDARRGAAETLQRSLRRLGLEAVAESTAERVRTAEGELTLEAGMRALEFAAAWLGSSRSVEGGGPWVRTPVPVPPRIRQHVFQSARLGRSVGYSLYLPERGVDAREGRCPVLYHVPGPGELGMNASETMAYLDSAIRFGGVKPMAWVWLNAGRSGWCADSADGRAPTETVWLTEAIPHIEERWGLGGTAETRALDGWGLGAWAVLRWAGMTPARFSGVLLHEPELPELGTFPSRYPEVWEQVFGGDPGRFRALEPVVWAGVGVGDAARAVPSWRLRVVVGDGSPTLLDALRLKEWAVRQGVRCEYQSVPGGGGTNHLAATGLVDLRFVAEATETER